MVGNTGGLIYPQGMGNHPSDFFHFLFILIVKSPGTRQKGIKTASHPVVTSRVSFQKVILAFHHLDYFVPIPLSCKVTVEKSFDSLVRAAL